MRFDNLEEARKERKRMKPNSGFVAAAAAGDDGPRRFDFSKAGMAQRQKGAADRHGARVITDRFGNRRLVREGEELDLSYQDKYEIEEHENADGTRSGYVDLRQDPFVERMAEIAKKMVTNREWIKTKGPTPQIVSEEQMRQNIADGDDPEDYRPVNAGALTSLVKKAADLGLASTEDLDERALMEAELYEERYEKRLMSPDYDETLLIVDSTGDAMYGDEINPDIPARVKKFGYGNRPPVSFEEEVDEDEIEQVFKAPRREPAEIAPEYKEMGRKIAKATHGVTVLTCGGCGFDGIGPSMNFCPKCGIEASSAILVCDQCGEEVTMDMNFCPSCGKKMAPVSKVGSKR